MLHPFGTSRQVVPTLSALLRSDDAKVLEHACVALSRVAAAFAAHPARLSELCTPGKPPHPQKYQPHCADVC